MNDFKKRTYDLKICSRLLNNLKRSCKRFRNSCTKFVGTIFIILNTHFKAQEHYENTKLSTCCSFNFIDRNYNYMYFNREKKEEEI